MGLLQDASLIVTPNAYKAGKLYSVVPSDGTGDFTVTRATSATRVNSAGLIETVGINVPRLDYTNASCPSILVEPQKINLLLRSEEFENASWVNGLIQSRTPNTTISPSGNLTADKIFPANNNGAHFLYQPITTNTTTTQTASCYFKASEYTRCGIKFNDNNISQGQIFDLILGQTVGSLGTKTNGRITSVGNGWYRCVVTISSPTSLKNVQFCIVDNTSTVFDFIGTITSGLFIWGAQLELGGNATSYIPTTTATVTRNVDLISKSGISNLIGQTEGSIYCEINHTVFNQTTGIFVLRNNITPIDNRIGLRYDSNYIGSISGFIRNSTGFIVNLYTPYMLTVGQKYKMCFTYNQTVQKLFVNGLLVSSRTGSYAQPSTLDEVQLGTTISGYTSNVGINSALVFKNVLSDSEAIQLTTL